MPKVIEHAENSQDLFLPPPPLPSVAELREHAESLRQRSSDHHVWRGRRDGQNAWIEALHDQAFEF